MMIGSARLIDNLYYFDDNRFENKQAQGFIDSVRSSPMHDQIILWHNRLGHPSFFYLKHLFSGLVKGLACTSFDCETYFLAKSHHNSYKIKSYYASKSFYLIHSDVWGLSRITTLTGKKWFVTFIDDHTHLCWLYLMNSKSEVPKLFQDFYSMVENQFQTKISIL